MRLFTLFIFLILIPVFAIPQNRDPEQQEAEKDQKLLELAESVKARQQAEKDEAVRMARQKGWPVRAEMDDGTLIEIKRIDKYGMPEYDITNNLNAAKTSETDHLWVGGVSGLDLSGEGMLVGEWDGGGVLTSHQEFDNGSGTRVTQRDSPAGTHYHATHVAGTIIAEGQVNAAHGMAPEASLDAYDWDSDLSEMITAAANDDLILSNHSYGRIRGWRYNSSNGNWYWYGNTSISSTEDYEFGFYGDLAEDWDEAAFNAPHYLIVKSAGNDRDDSHSGGHFYWNGSSWTWSTASRDPDGGSDGYDCIGNRGVAKNILTVGSVGDIPSGYSSPGDVVIASYSGWGPTDDGRIKPDIVANGQSLYSTDDDFNSDYTTLGGTSMSTPTATGTLTLLQEHYNNLRGGFMSAAALKGLVINTAHEAGPDPGPDYMHGWGLLNATGAAELISEDDEKGGLIVEGILDNYETKDFTYYSDGSEINITLSWTDPAGNPVSAQLNPTDLMLVNDLNVRLIRQSTGAYYYPWRLSPSDPDAAATKGDNFRDNVETVNLTNPTPGYYTIRITHDGALQNGEQAYALIVDGLEPLPYLSYCDAGSGSFNVYEYISRVQIGDIDNTSGRSAGGYHNYSGLSTTIDRGSGKTITVNLEGYSGSTGYAWIDWNQDGALGEDEKVELGQGTGPYSATITAPMDAVSGYTIMRVRVGFGNQTACSINSWSETEDYAIKVNGTPGSWIGVVSSDWHDIRNWDDWNIPDVDDAVVINASAPHQPEIDAWAKCQSLFMQSGATLTHNSSYLDVHGTFDAGFGQYTMTSSSAYLYLMGPNNALWWDDNQNDTYTEVRIWKDNNSATVTQMHDVSCSGSFRILRGTHLLNTGRTLSIQSTIGTAFTVESDGIFTLSDNQTLDVEGGIYFSNGSQADVDGGEIFCGGNLNLQNNTSFDIQFPGTDFTFNDSEIQYIADYDGNLLLNNLIIDKPDGTVYIQNNDLQLAGNLEINQGELSCKSGPSTTMYYDIALEGNWINNAGPSSFHEEEGRVIFNGSGHQYIYGDEDFNILEVDNTAALRINSVSDNVTCGQYDWTQGGIDVLAGNFTIDDLMDEGLYGKFYCNPGGTLSIYQDDSQWLDLNGELHVFGGTVSVIGGSDSWWPFAGDALIQVTGGELNFDSPVRLNNSGSYSFTEDITGGTIRFYDSFFDERGDFTPEGGTIEFVGETGSNLSLYSGSNFYNLLIDKGVARSNSLQGQAAKPSVKKDKLNSSAKKERRAKTNYQENRAANTLTYTSYIDVENNLTINSGFLECGTQQSDDHTLDVGGDWNDAANGFIPHSGTVQLYDASDNVIGTDATFYNLQIFKNYTFFFGTITMADNINVDVENNLSIVEGTFSFGENTVLNIGNHLNINNQTLMDASGVGNVDITIAGNWYNQNSANDGTKGFSPGTSSVTFNGSTQQFIDSDAGEEVFHHLTINSTYFAGIPVLSPLKCTGNLQILDGALGPEQACTIHGDFFVAGTGTFIPLAAVTFAGNSSSTYENNSSVSGIMNNGVILAKEQSDHMLTLNSDMISGWDLTLSYGTLELNGYSLIFGNDISINNGATLYADEGSSLRSAGDGEVAVQSGGTVELIGNSPDPVMMTAFTPEDGERYLFSVESGGNISARYVIFEYMKGSNGIDVKNGANVDPVNNFSYCVFRNGPSIYGSAFLTIDNSQDLTIENAHFPSATATYNVNKSVDQGNITFTGFTGSFSGEDHDYDPHNRIDWYAPELSVTPPVRNVGAPSGSTTFTVTSNIDWTATESGSWFSISPGSGTGNGTLSVFYTENTSLSSRSGEITVSGDGVPDVVVTVIQAGVAPFLTITPDNAFVDPEAGSTTFNLSSNADWTISETYGWVSVSPSSGNGNATITVFYTQNTGADYRYADIEISAAAGTLNETFQLTQNAYESHTLNIPGGWSGISSFIMPADNDIINVMSPVGSNFVIMQTMNGVLYPDGSINTIGTWESQSAYKIKLAAGSTLDITGEEETNKTLSMNSGWSLLPVISNVPVEAASLFGGTDLVILKEVAGPGLIWPEYGINTLGSDLYPGMSYYALMGSAESITFPPNAKNTGSYEIVHQESPQHPWNDVAKGPSSHTIAVLSNGLSGIMPGDVIGVFDASGNCFGVSQIRSLTENTALSAYADDPWTAARDGFSVSEQMHVKLYRPETGEISDVWVEWDQNLSHTGYFSPEGMSAITALKVSSLGFGDGSASDDQISIYPNPAITTVQISGLENFGQIEIISASGRLVKSLSTETKRKIEINVSDFAPGVYQVRFSGDRSTVVKKLIRK